MSKDVSRREGGRSLSMFDGAVLVVVGVVGAIVAFWILGHIVGIIFGFIKVALVVALIAGAFYFLARRKR